MREIRLFQCLKCFKVFRSQANFKIHSRKIEIIQCLKCRKNVSRKQVKELSFEQFKELKSKEE